MQPPTNHPMPSILIHPEGQVDPVWLLLFFVLYHNGGACKRGGVPFGVPNQLTKLSSKKEENQHTPCGLQLNDAIMAYLPPSRPSKPSNPEPSQASVPAIKQPTARLPDCPLPASESAVGRLASDKFDPGSSLPPP